LKEKLINESKIEDIKQEIADVFIYLMSMVNAMNLDLTEIFYQKMEKNRKKYPVDEFHDGNYNKK
jgi:NTP pyrophosphatase (non-canonical NTP hydrolase)